MEMQENERGALKMHLNLVNFNTKISSVCWHPRNINLCHIGIVQTSFKWQTSWHGIILKDGSGQFYTIMLTLYMDNLSGPNKNGQLKLISHSDYGILLCLYSQTWRKVVDQDSNLTEKLAANFCEFSGFVGSSVCSPVFI